MNNKDLTINALKGLAIILVVYGHLIQQSMVVAAQDFFLNPIFKIIYTFHMPLFFFISGYLIAFSLSHRSTVDILKIRTKGLMVPFVVWGILWMMTVYALRLPGILDNKDNMPVWFIWFLFTLFISSCLLLCSVELKKYIGWAAFPTVYLLLLIIPYNHYFGFYYIKWFYVFYLAGYLVNHYDLKITHQLTRVILFVSFIIFVIGVSYWDKGDYIYNNKMTLSAGHYVDEFLRIMYRYMMGFLGIFITWRLVAYLAKTKIQHLLGYVGIYSLDIYLIQRYIIEGFYPKFISKIHMAVNLSEPLVIYFFIPLLALILTGVCLIISRLLIRRSVILNKLLLGNRT